MMKGIIVNKSGRMDGHWDVITSEEFERDYHIRPKTSERIYQLQTDGRDYYITSWDLVCGLYMNGQLFYVDYYPNIIINGRQKMDLIPDSEVVETIEEIYDEIRRINEQRIAHPEIIIEWEKR